MEIERNSWSTWIDACVLAAATQSNGRASQQIADCAVTLRQLKQSRVHVWRLFVSLPIGQALWHDQQ